MQKNKDIKMMYLYILFNVIPSKPVLCFIVGPDFLGYYSQLTQLGSKVHITVAVSPELFHSLLLQFKTFIYGLSSDNWKNLN